MISEIDSINTIERIDISLLPKPLKDEIANYIKRDTLSYVNSKQNSVELPRNLYTLHGKRAIDIFFSSIAIVLTIPINLIIAIVTYFDVGNPIIFKQKRIGKGKKTFTIYKFRNMTNDTDINGVLLPPSERVTNWGKFVRKTSLDELLNFVSILKGDMSIIGPRPLLDYYKDRLNKKHLSIYNVKPGLECPVLNDSLTDLDWEDRLDNYVWYVQNCSLKNDIMLAIKVFLLVFDRDGIKRRSNAITSGLLGYDYNGHVITTKNVPKCYIDEYCNKHYTTLDEIFKERKTSRMV